MMLCYNKGCGQQFKEAENNDESCTYHPGAPIFHDAYKGWSCCNKKSTDFTTFLNTKGCSKGKHNSNKPVETVKPTLDKSKDEVITVRAPKPIANMERPDINLPIARLTATVQSTLIQALAKETEKMEDVTVDTSQVQEYNGIKIGESCKNNNCKAVYEGVGSSLEMCQHHPGCPVFHEGLKYWSCCQKKTTDFTEFLEQAGCETGYHVWIKKETKKVDSCRYDWHQTSTHVVVTIYAKNSIPSLTYVDANPVRMKAHIVFQGSDEFTMDHELGGVIDVSQSSVSLAASKVEIKLRKAEPMSWKRLNLPANQANKTDDQKQESVDCADELNIESVDLSDI